MRSKKYKQALSQIDKNKSYSVPEAIKLAKQISIAKFDASVEFHARLGIDPKKGEQSVRGSVTLPHGTGKTKRVAVFCSDLKQAEAAGADIVGNDELIKQIKASAKIDFDVAVATTDAMKTLAPIAKVLGPRGLMPSPKAGTVIPPDKLADTVKAIKAGKISFKNDDSANIHQMIGKISWPDEKLKQNLEVFIQALKKTKPQSVKGEFILKAYLSASISPSIRLSL